MRASVLCVLVAASLARGGEGDDPMQLFPPAAPDARARFVLFGRQAEAAPEGREGQVAEVWEVSPWDRALVRRARLARSPWAAEPVGPAELLRLQVPGGQPYSVHLYVVDYATWTVRRALVVDQASPLLEPSAGPMDRPGPLVPPSEPRVFLRVNRTRLGVVDLTSGEAKEPRPELSLVSPPSTPGGPWLVTLVDGPRFAGALYDPREDRVVARFPHEGELVEERALNVALSNGRVAVSLDGERVRLIDPAAGQVTNPSRELRLVQALTGDEWLVRLTKPEDGRDAAIWDLAADRARATFALPAGWVGPRARLTASPDRRHLLRVDDFTSRVAFGAQVLEVPLIVRGLESGQERTWTARVWAEGGSGFPVLGTTFSAGFDERGRLRYASWREGLGPEAPREEALQHFAVDLESGAAEQLAAEPQRHVAIPVEPELEVPESLRAAVAAVPQHVHDPLHRLGHAALAACEITCAAPVAWSDTQVGRSLDRRHLLVWVRGTKLALIDLVKLEARELALPAGLAVDDIEWVEPR